MWAPQNPIPENYVTNAGAPHAEPDASTCGLSRVRLARRAPSLWRLATPGIACAALLLLPILSRPFTLDDTLFLRQSEHLLVDPWHATAFEYAWFDSLDRVSKLMPSGPVQAYLLLPTIWSGGAEWVAHLTQLLLVALTVLATASLGRRLRLPAGATMSAGLLVATTPALMAMAATAMPDVAATTFGALAIERAVAYVAERRWHQGVTAAFALAFAVLARSHLLLACGVVLLLAFGPRLYHPKQWPSLPLKVLWPVPLALALVALAVTVTRDPQKEAQSIWDAARGFTGSGATGSNFAAYCAHWVMTLPLGIAWIVLYARRLIAGRLLWFCVPAMGILLLRLDVPEWRWLTVVAGIGAAVVADVLADAYYRRDVVQTALGAWLLLPLPILLYTHLPCKYAAACAPAVALLIARAAWVRGWFFRNAVILMCLALGSGLSALIIRADTKLSGLARDVAREWIAPEVRARKHVWFAGHWGFQWYAERAGATPLVNARPGPQAGDLLVVSTESWAPMNLVGAVSAKTLLKTREDAVPGGRIMRDRAGFYSNYWGYLPWTYSDLPSDSIQLWRIDETPEHWP